MLRFLLIQQNTYLTVYIIAGVCQDSQSKREKSKLKTGAHANLLECLRETWSFSRYTFFPQILAVGWCQSYFLTNLGCSGICWYSQHGSLKIRSNLRKKFDWSFGSSQVAIHRTFNQIFYETLLNMAPAFHLLAYWFRFGLYLKYENWYSRTFIIQPSVTFECGKLVW